MTFQIKCKNPIPRGQGIEHIEVDKNDRTKLFVHFLENANDDSELVRPGNYVIKGGRRIHAKVSSVNKVSANSVVLHLDREGDFSIYTLEINNIQTSDFMPVDPFFASNEFSFKIQCDSEFDCKETEEEEIAAPADDGMVMDYMARDYDSFRRALVDLIPLKIPSWTDTSEADSGMVLLELFAHLADQMSYYQDRVANEAFLKTATQRISVKLHSDLIDYRMHNGASATTYIYFKAIGRDLLPKGFPVSGGGVMFELDEDAVLDEKFNRMQFYSWGNTGCCLPEGSTGAFLDGDFSNLAKGDSILIQDTRKRDDQDYAYPWKREVVQLVGNSKAQSIKDPLDPSRNIIITDIQWHVPLKYDYCLDEGAAIACGNMARASHGERKEGTKEEELNESDMDEIGGRPTFTLKYAPLAYLVKTGDLRDAEPDIEIKVDGKAWKRVRDILESGPFDQHYTVATDNESYGIITFGNGQFGQRPQARSKIELSYRIGCGTAGNVGRDTLKACEKRSSIDSVNNPLVAAGGVDPEPLEDVKMNAPGNIRKDLYMYRAITPQDYEQAINCYTENGLAVIERAKARFIWTGSWYTVFISIDPAGSEELSDDLKNNIKLYLQKKKLAGYDIKIEPAVYVPLEIKLKVCIEPNFFTKDIKEAVGEVLGNWLFADSRKSFFHPDNFTFGDSVYASKLYAALENITGVGSAEIITFRRQREQAIFESSEKKDTSTLLNLKQGYIRIGEIEIAQLDNDRNYPENGILLLEFIGGK